MEEVLLWNSVFCRGLALLVFWTTFQKEMTLAFLIFTLKKVSIRARPFPMSAFWTGDLVWFVEGSLDLQIREEFESQPEPRYLWPSEARGFESLRLSWLSVVRMLS